MFVHFMTDQAGMMVINRAVEALADDPAPAGAFVRGDYRRLRVGSYRVLYEVEGNLITIVRIDRVWAAAHRVEQLPAMAWGPQATS
jgi:ParE toxin of type II toxin-antitoxin system, parDE